MADIDTPVPALRYLCDADVAAVLPPLTRVVDLAEEALVARAHGRAQVPPKPTVFFGDNAFANAMPVAMTPRREAAEDAAGTGDEVLLGCKWIALQPDNPVRGMPTASGVMIVCDGDTGLPVALMAAGELTAVRTAAVTVACLRAWIGRDEPVAFVGTGAQAFSHLRVLAACGFTDVRFVGRRPEAREALLAAAEQIGASGRVTVTGSHREGLSGAAAIVTGLPIGLRGQEVDASLVRDDAVLLPLDYASSIGAGLARTATLTSDDVHQFAAVRPVKLGRDYPEASDWTGNAIGAPKPAGRLLAQNLGNACSDIVLAAEIAREAHRRGVGTELPR